MRAKIEKIVENFEATIKYNTDINPEDAFNITCDALESLIQSKSK